MSLEAFLDEVNRPDSSGGNTFTDIAKARVFFCWQGWTNNKSQVFEYEANNDESCNEAKDRCQEYIDSGVNDRDQWPQQGICTHIFGDWIPTNADGCFYWGDTFDFAKKYESDKNLHKLTEDEQRKVTGSMPFNLVVEGIIANPSVFGQEQYVKISQEINQWSKAKGKKNKKGYAVLVYVVRHVYKNKAEAEDDAVAINGSQAISQPQAANKMSNKANETWGTLAKLQAKKDKIENMIRDAINGIGTPNDKKLKPDKAREFVIIGYGIEESDLLLIGIEELKKSPVETQAHVTKNELKEEEIPF